MDEQDAEDWLKRVEPGRKVKELLAERKTFAEAGADLGISEYDAIMGLTALRREAGKINSEQYDNIERIAHKIVVEGLSYQESANKLELTKNAVLGIVGRHVRNQLAEGVAFREDPITKRDKPSSENARPKQTPTGNAIHAVDENVKKRAEQIMALRQAGATWRVVCQKFSMELYAAVMTLVNAGNYSDLSKAKIGRIIGLLIVKQDIEAAARATDNTPDFVELINNMYVLGRPQQSKAAWVMEQKNSGSTEIGC